MNRKLGFTTSISPNKNYRSTLFNINNNIFTNCRNDKLHLCVTNNLIV